MPEEKVFGEHPDYAFRKIVDETIDRALKTKDFPYVGNF